jgi:RimJ/RimL family protein N-acetyltransferase
MILTTERLILRDFFENDWETVLAYQQDPLYLRYNEWTSRTPEEVREFVQMFLHHQKQQPRLKFQLAITLKSNNQLIGNCGVRRDSSDAHEGDIGYELNSKFWGNGYATEAARAIMHFGFSHMNLQRILAWCVADNVGSARVLEKLGMRLERRVLDHQYFKGRWWDTLSYAISYEEWQMQTSHENLIESD